MIVCLIQAQYMENNIHKKNKYQSIKKLTKKLNNANKFNQLK